MDIRLPTQAGGTAPKISVVITCYNYANYVGAAIESVLNQSYKDIELIVVDDGSTDGSQDVIRSYGVHLVERTNGGHFASSATGAALTTGEIVMFLDADDSFYPDTCARVAAAYAPDIALYQAGLVMVDTQGREVGRYPDMPLIDDGHVDYLLKHGFYPSPPTSGNAYSGIHVRRMLAEGLRRNPTVRNGLDGFLIFSAPFVGRIVRLDHDGPFGTYLVHGANMSMAGGMNRASAERSTRSGLQQRAGISIVLDLLGKPHLEPADYLTAFLLRYVLILRLTYGVTDLLADRSSTRIAWDAARKFLTYPGLSLGQRVKNITFLGALLLGNRSLSRKIMPPAPAPAIAAGSA